MFSYFTYGFSNKTLFSKGLLISIFILEDIKINVIIILIDRYIFFYIKI